LVAGCDERIDYGLDSRRLFVAAGDFRDFFGLGSTGWQTGGQCFLPRHVDSPSGSRSQAFLARFRASMVGPPQRAAPRRARAARPAVRREGLFAAARSASIRLSAA
jgi:hypothetical protein